MSDDRIRRCHGERGTSLILVIAFMLVIGGKGGYVERDGHVLSDEDLERRINLGKESTR